MLHTEKVRLLKKAKKHLKKKQLNAAALIYEKICTKDGTDASIWLKLGEIYWQANRRQQAADCYQQSVSLDPKVFNSAFKLGTALHALGNFVKAQSSYEQALELNPDSAEVYFYLGNLFKDQALSEQAEASYRQSVQLNPKQARAQCNLGIMLQNRCQIDEALVCYDKALALEPDLSEAIWSKLRILPTIIESNKQLEEYRQRYSEGIETLSTTLTLNNQVEIDAVLWGFLSTSAFLLQYQGRDDRVLQEKSASIAQRTMAAHFPQWSKPIKMPELQSGEKIRIGYASSYLCLHNGAVWLLGWLKQCDRDRFEIFCYHTGSVIDEKTKEFEKLADHFYHLPNDLKAPCQKIVANKLHILVYPELGMYAPTYLMAALYLAPIQCTSWGHPVTSGLATLDYWISSDLMEPENGQTHYSEKLVRLPGIAISYSSEQSDEIEAMPIEKSRADFGLHDDSVLYFCSQSLFKYLPDYDRIYIDIAKKVPKAQFVFLSVLNDDVVSIFKKRLDLAFSNAGLNADDFCIILPRLVQEDYVTMNRLVDVFLDNPSWSGANTTLIAIDCNLPVVTLPTDFMRGRHSYAILKMMGITETIANTVEGYVEIATRLGVDVNWRSEISQKINDTKHKLYNDTECVQGLENFYVQAVADQVGR